MTDKNDITPPTSKEALIAAIMKKYDSLPPEKQDEFFKQLKDSTPSSVDAKAVQDKRGSA